MHVSIATITALLLRRIGLTWLGLFWLSAIWIGSFHLGWHYASDGIVSIIVTAAIWKAVSSILTHGAKEPPLGAVLRREAI
jgi:PAP2 superfamily